MNWTDLKITVSTKDAETAEAIAQMAVPYGIYIEDYSDMLELVPQIAHIDLIDEDLLARSRTEAILHLYLPPEENPAEASAFLTHRLEAEGIPYRIETDQTLAEEDWANAWKRFYHPTHLGKRLVVCPSWEEYTPTPEELVMTLDPGMAFGSGTHHTTRLCCELREQLPGLLRGTECPRAAFVQDNETAVELLHLLRREELRVPEDIEILCQQNTKLAKLADPALSVLAPAGYQVGMVGAKCLMDHLDRGDTLAPLQLVAPNLVKRGSIK